MAQQSPLSTSLSVQNSVACPQTLASGFNPCSSVIPNTFAVDPNFRVGYAQTWQLAVQTRSARRAADDRNLSRDQGNAGSAGVPAEYLSNRRRQSMPVVSCRLCLSAPRTAIRRREAGSIQLRRRLRSGFTATLLYTYSKSIDDDSVLGGQGPVATTTTTGAGAGNELAAWSTGAATQSSTPQTPVIAQNWLDLSAERGLSTFDQRNLLNAQVQYTTGVGLGGGALLSGWRGKVLKRWTVLGQITAGSGLPETPIYLAAVPGTGVTGSIRPKRHRCPTLCCARRLSSESRCLHRRLSLASWGDAQKKLDHRPGTVQLQCVAGANLPPEGSLQPRSTGGFDESAQPCRLHQLEYDVESRPRIRRKSGLEQSALRTTDGRQRNAQPANHDASEVLKYAIPAYTILLLATLGTEAQTIGQNSSSWQQRHSDSVGTIADCHRDGSRQRQEGKHDRRPDRERLHVDRRRRAADDSLL